MKLRFLYILLPVFVFLSISAQVADDFTDGDFTANPVWSGDASLFTINTGQLQSQSPSAATYYLSTPSTLSANAQWDFFIDLKLGTSGSNYVDVYVMADQADLTTVNNGYFIRIGNTSDEISLYKRVAGVNTILIDGADGLVNSSSSNPFNIRLIRDVSDNWTLQYDDLGASPSGGFVAGGTANDGTLTSCTHFGFIITQSTAASAVNNHFFDNFSAATVAPDTQAPSVTSVTVTSSNTLEVLFDEAVDVTTAQTTTNYVANNSIGSPGNVVVNGGNPALVELTFGTAFTQGVTNQLTVSNVEDAAGNVMTSSNHDFLYFVPVPAVVGDVLINEIFADPSPQIGLPNSEYVEVINVSNKIFDLQNWTISDGSSSGTFPSYLLMPGEVVAIADDGAIVEFSIFSNIIFATSLPGLNNASDDLFLRDENSALIDQVSYTDDWYQDPVKDDGGYSLELINPNLPCASASNWIASNDPNGGTPGTQNSVYDITPDVTAPSLISTTVQSGVEIELCFSESLDTVGFATSYFSINNGLNVGFYTISSDLTCVSIYPTPALDTGVIYTVTINGVGDCSGNTLTSGSAEAILPASALAGDLIINEVLFNPFTGGSDFVEVYNNSEKYIDLFGFLLANFDDGSIDNYKKVTTHKLMNPGDFAVITKDSADIKLNYLNAVVGSFIELSSLPSYNDDSATVVLALPDSSISDYFSYDNDMQYPLIKDDDGVSLERIDYNRSAQDMTNWHSGAENVGWATPGKENSQYYPNVITDDMVSTSPEVFSPDNDGYEDVLNISYTLDGPGYVGNITIFDRQGRTVKSLLQSELLSPEGVITWDGTNNNREKAPIGVYIIYFEIFDLDGNVSSVKKSTVLGGRF